MKLPTKWIVVGYVGVSTRDGRIILDLERPADLGVPQRVPVRTITRVTRQVEVYRRGPELVAEVPLIWWPRKWHHIELHNVEIVAPGIGPLDRGQRIEMKADGILGIFVRRGGWPWPSSRLAWAWVRR